MTNATVAAILTAQNAKFDALLQALTHSTPTAAPATAKRATASKASTLDARMDSAAIAKYVPNAADKKGAKAARLAYEAVKARHVSTPKQVATAATMVLNAEKHGVELFFNGIPTNTIRAAMKAQGFRFNSKTVCWYAKQAASTLKMARSIAG